MKVLNDLYDYTGYKIVQDSEYFKFFLDSILLAEFVSVKNQNLKILDLCTGNAVIPLILSYYYKNNIIGFELQKEVSLLANESIEINHKQDQINIIQDDIKNIKNYFPGNNFDVIVCNPPYFKYQECSLINQNEVKSIARHEIYLNLKNIFEIVNYSLKSNGEFYLVHLPERLEEILYLCECYKIRAKHIQFIYTDSNKNAKMVLIKCVKGANQGVKIAPPIEIKKYKSFQNIFRRSI